MKLHPFLCSEMLKNGAKVLFFRERHTWRLDKERGWLHAGFHMGMWDTGEGNVSLKVAVLSWLSWSFCTWWVSNNASTLPRSVLQDHNSCGGNEGIRPRFQPSPRLGLHGAHWKLLAVLVQWHITHSCSKRWKNLGAGWFVLQKWVWNPLIPVYKKQANT